MSDIEIGSVWVSKKNVSAILVVTDVSDSRVETHWYGDPDNKFEWLKDDFLSKYDLQQDMVNHPPHYKDASGIECIEVTSKMQFCGGNCFKYLYRAGKKGSTVEDLKKAIWYAERANELKEVTNEQPAAAIWDIASYRRGNVKEAMRFVSNYAWDVVVECINAEIARLESEAADD